MYLLVFVFLLMATIGMYAQVYALQASKMFNSQTGFAQIMVKWHSAAKDLAQDNSTDGNTASGCALSPTFPSGQRCSDTLNGMNHTYIVQQPGSALALAIQGAHPAYAGLPSGYNYAAYQWESIVYRPIAGGVRYVVTFVDPTSTGDETIQTPQTAGITVGELYRQVLRLKLDPSVYGLVQTTGSLQVANLAAIPRPSTMSPSVRLKPGAVFLISSF